MEIKFVVEHLEDELFEWSLLEYEHMLMCVGAGNLIITNCKVPNQRLSDKGAIVISMPASEYINGRRAILLDQCTDQCLKPEDADSFEFVVVGGILGTDEFDGPMVDRTGSIRSTNAFTSRHLGPRQMTADTAVIVSKRILVDEQTLDSMLFIDRPTIPLRKRESVEMPFRYLQIESSQQRPLLPPGMIDLLKDDDSFLL